MGKLTAVILAAGNSGRMRKPKALLDYGGKCFIEHVCAALRSAGVEERIAVLGRDAAAITAVWKPAGEKVVVNPAPDMGQLSSLRVGIEAASEESECFMICLADQPTIAPQTYKDIIAFWRGRKDHIIIPRVFRSADSAPCPNPHTLSSKRGHPIIIPAVYRHLCFEGPQALGLHWVTHHPSVKVSDFTVEDTGIIRDFDTPQDYQNLRARDAHIILSRALKGGGGKFLKLFFYGFLLFAAAVLFANVMVNYKTANLTFDDAAKIKPNKTGLLLGTSRFLKGGGKNPFFYNRIDAAVELYRAGKIENIIVSGDNRTRFYNEPEDMKKELLKRGIPENIIYLDYAGRRTLDSVIRCGEVFGQNSFTVISQKFHNQRAVFLGRLSGFDVIGFNAKGVDYFWGLKTRLREYFARVNMFADLFFGKKPRFLGEKIDIE